MKARTGTKIFLYSIVILLILALSFSASMALLNSYETKLKEVPVFNTVRVAVNPAINAIRENYQNISEYQRFKSSLNPVMQRIHGQLQIIGLDGTVLFDSEHENAAHPVKVDTEGLVHYDSAFLSQNPGLVRFAFPIVINEKQVANAVFVLPNNELFNLKGPNPLSPYFPLLAGGLLSVIILTILLVHIIKTVLKPIRNLNSAAAEVAKGNLDFKLDYGNFNELGAFTQAFDLMKANLRDSIYKQNKLEQERKELVAAISHDIKTPLASIKAYAEGLRDGIAKKPEAAEKYLDVIITKTDGLTKLVNDLLQHSIQDLGNLKVNLEEHYSKQLLLGIIEPLQLQLAQKGVSLDLEGELPEVLIKADAARIEQVIVNIVENAKKYSQAGGKIILKAAIEDECLMVSIRDNGFGIPPEELPFVFHRFYRGEKVRTGVFDGAGLGLSICKYIIEQHGGVIFVESAPDKGSTFHFAIPKI